MSEGRRVYLDRADYWTRAAENEAGLAEGWRRDTDTPVVIRRMNIRECQGKVVEYMGYAQESAALDERARKAGA